MMKMLTSWWFSLIVGLAVFVGVVAVIWTPTAPPPTEATEGGEAAAAGKTHAEDAVAQLLSTNAPLYANSITPLEDVEAGAPGTLKFDNPEVKILMKDLETQRTALAAERRDLNDLKRRLQLEVQTIGSVTSVVAQAIAEFEKAQSSKVISLEKDDEKQYRSTASILTNMAPANAVKIMLELPTDQVVQILQRISSDGQRAALLDEMAKTKPTNAAEITKAFLRIGTKPQTP